MARNMKEGLESSGQPAPYCQFLALGRWSMAGMGSTCWVTMFMVPSRRETWPRMISNGSLMTCRYLPN